MADKCAICGADINLIQTQRLADGSCICRKNCRQKGFKVYDYVSVCLFRSALFVNTLNCILTGLIFKQLIKEQIILRCSLALRKRKLIGTTSITLTYRWSLVQIIPFSILSIGRYSATGLRKGDSAARRPCFFSFFGLAASALSAFSLFALADRLRITPIISDIGIKFILVVAQSIFHVAYGNGSIILIFGGTVLPNEQIRVEIR